MRSGRHHRPRLRRAFTAAAGTIAVTLTGGAAAAAAADCGDGPGCPAGPVTVLGAGPDVLHHAQALAVGPGGDVFAADAAGRVLRFDAAGAPVRSYAAPDGAALKAPLAVAPDGTLYATTAAGDPIGFFPDGHVTVAPAGPACAALGTTSPHIAPQAASAAGVYGFNCNGALRRYPRDLEGPPVAVGTLGGTRVRVTRDGRLVTSGASRDRFGNPSTSTYVIANADGSAPTTVPLPADYSLLAAIGDDDSLLISVADADAEADAAGAATRHVERRALDGTLLRRFASGVVVDAAAGGTLYAQTRGGFGTLPDTSTPSAITPLRLPAADALADVKAVAALPDGGAAVLDAPNDRVSLFTADGRVSSVPLGFAAASIAVTPAGVYAVTSPPATARLVRYDTASAAWVTVATVRDGGGWGQLANGPDGTLLINSADGLEVRRPDGALVRTLVSGTAPGYSAVTAAPDGRVYAVSDQDQTLYRFAADGTELAPLPLAVSGSVYPRSITVGPAGRLYVQLLSYTEPASDLRILVVDPATGATVSSFGGRGTAPGTFAPGSTPAIAMAPDGTLLAGDGAAQRLQAFGFPAATVPPVDPGPEVPAPPKPEYDACGLVAYAPDAGGTLNGTAAADSLYGGLHADLLNGLDGDDCLAGGRGDDRLFGQAGNDRLRGDDGDDYLHGMDDQDALSGGAGRDEEYGGAGQDDLDGDTGNDLLHGQGGDDVLDGGDGGDTLYGEAGRDHLDGGAGTDVLYGQEGADTIAGGPGADRLDGEAGDDTLSGDAGDDQLKGGVGRDTLSGGAGNDTIDAVDGQVDTVSCGAGTDTVLADAKDKVAKDCERRSAPRYVIVTVRCAGGGETGCTGDLALSASATRRAAGTAGRARYAVSPGATSRIPVALTGRWAHGRTLRVRASGRGAVTARTATVR